VVRESICDISFASSSQCVSFRGGVKRDEVDTSMDSESDSYIPREVSKLQTVVAIKD
jgi:hypothetical protein